MPFELLFVAAVFLLPGPLVIYLMYFHFRVRPPTWPMKLASVATVLVMWLCVDVGVGWTLAAASGGDEYPMPIWAFVLPSVLLLPFCYVGAYVGCVILALIDKARFRAHEFASDRPEMFSVSYWFNRKLGRSLILVPVLAFAFATLVSKAASLVSIHSAIDWRKGPERYDFVHPMLFPLNQSVVLMVRLTTATRDKVSCNLAAPAFDVEPVTLGSDEGQLLADGVASGVPDCLWLATARRSGSQKAVLKISFSRPEVQPAVPHSDQVPMEIVDIESLHVAGGLFTTQGSFVVIMIPIFFAGVLRLTRAARQDKNTEAPLKARSPKVRLDVESKLYDGETKLK
jgi:hypothetical protein